MSPKILREVSAPEVVRLDDEAVGRETIIIRRDGEPVAAVVPYAEYQQWQAAKSVASPLVSLLPIDPGFLKQWRAFQRLRPELVRKHPGQWVAVVNEQVVEVGPDFATVAQRVDRFGDVPMCIAQVLETPRVYHLPYRKVVHRED